MMKLDVEERKIMGGSILVLAIAAGALATALGLIAISHMVTLQVLCASPTQHCLACYGALASSAVSLITGCTAATLLLPRANLSYACE